MLTGVTDNGSGPHRPTVTRLSTTPVKGFSLGHPDQVTLDSNGAVGDRDFFLVDDKHRLISITKTGAFASWRADFDRDRGILSLVSSDGKVLEDRVVEDKPVVADFSGSRGVPGHFVAGPWSAGLSEIVGQPISLVRAKEPGEAFDEHPVTMVSEESVAELARATSVDAIDLRRFRMLMNISGVDPYEEESWRHKTVRIGSATLQMGGPVPRCNATTRDPDSGKKDLKTLALISQARGMQPNEFGDGLNIGAYAQVLEPGVVTVGDELELS
jgi:MOSC domain-containing protein